MGLTMSYIQTVHTLLSNVVTRIFNALPFLTRERTPFLTTFSSPASPPSCLSVCLSVRMVFPAIVVMWRMDVSGRTLRKRARFPRSHFAE